MSKSDEYDTIVMKSATRQYEVMSQAVANLIKQLGEGHPKVLADITKEEHNALSVALAYAGWLDSELLRNYVNDFLRLSPARKGKRADQLTKIGVASLSPQIEEDGYTQKIKRWLRLDRG